MHELPTELQTSLRSWRGSVRLSRGEEFNQADSHRYNGESDDYANKKPASLPMIAKSCNMDEDSASETDSLLPKHLTDSRQHLYEGAARRPSYQTQTTTSSQNDLAKIRNNRPRSTSFQHDEHEEPDALSPHDVFTLLGMKQPSTSNPTPNHLESGHGLYHHLVHSERRVSRQYILYDTAIIMLMFFQLCISAVFVVLGSLPNLDAHHIAVASLGALGTIVAGVLALMKGQGLPNRLRMERDALRRVIFEAEEVYWDANAGREVGFDDVSRVRTAYMSVVEDARKNHPDVWTSSPVPIKAPKRRSQMSGAAEIAKS